VRPASPCAWYLRGMSLEAIESGEIVRRISARDSLSREAEAELCRRFAERARFYGLRHLRDEDRAHDLAQAVLVAVLEAARAGRIADHDKVERFVLGTCRNVALRMRENDDKQGVLSSDDAPLAEALAPAVDRVEIGALMRCLSAIDERARNVVLLSFHEGRDAAEIATILATTSGNVRVMRHRALAALRRCLDGRSEEARA